jgi:hypothetical protein
MQAVQVERPLIQPPAFVVGALDGLGGRCVGCQRPVPQASGLPG